MAETETAPEAVTPEVEAKAATMGWCPKDQWQGPPEKWKPADKFIEHGEEIMPILRANNRKLIGEVATLRNELSEAKQLLAASAESIEELKTFNTSMAKETGKQRKKELVAAIVKAREDEDVELEAELTEQLGEQVAALKKAEAAPAAPTRPAGGNGNGTGAPAPNGINPVVKQWNDENPWFGTDPHRTAIAQAEAQAMRADPNLAHLVGKREFLDEVSRRTEAFFSGRQGGPRPKVDGGRTPGGSGGGAAPTGGKTYADLPADAKAACDKQAARLVGKGRAFPDVGAWQKHYVAKYFES